MLFFICIILSKLFLREKCLMFYLLFCTQSNHMFGGCGYNQNSVLPSFRKGLWVGGGWVGWHERTAVTVRLRLHCFFKSLIFLGVVLVNWRKKNHLFTLCYKWMIHTIISNLQSYMIKHFSVISILHRWVLTRLVLLLMEDHLNIRPRLPVYFALT